MKGILGYTKTMDINIVRVKHKIAFRVGTRSIDLASMLSSVPDEATVDETVDNGDIVTIEFHEEKLLDERQVPSPTISNTGYITKNKF